MSLTFDPLRTRAPAEAFEMTPEDLLTAINPKRNPAFSPNLYAWIKYAPSGKLRGVPQFYRVVERTDADGKPDFMSGVPLIGWEDHISFIGSKLMSALCEGRKSEIGAYPAFGVGSNFTYPIEVIPNLWADYLTKGRCAFDFAHRDIFRESETRFKHLKEGHQEIRECRWCGARHLKVVRKKIVRVETWESASPAPAAQAA